MPGVGKGKDADLGFCQDGFRTNKRGEAERGGLSPGVPVGTNLAKKKKKVFDHVTLDRTN